MRLVLGRDEEVAEYASKMLAVKFVPPYVCFGVFNDDDQLCGAAIFNGFNIYSIEISVYGPGCLNRRFIRAFLDYAFNQAGVLNIRARTRRKNKRMCKLLPKFGFNFESILLNYFGPTHGDDAICYRLSRKAAQPWLT